MSEDKKTPNLNVTEMQTAGLHFGHNVSRLHPKMKAFVSGIKNNVHTIDLEKAAKEFENTLAFISKTASEGKTIMFVGTKIQIKAVTQKTAETCNMPYVIGRWLGGTFTNFETIAKRIFHFKDLESKKAHGDFDKYTKKERSMFDKELVKLYDKFNGIKQVTKVPEVVVILDMKKDIACVMEAKKKGIKIVGIVDTNIDPTLADYQIYANDDSISSVTYILEKIQEAILSGRQA